MLWGAESGTILERATFAGFPSFFAFWDWTYETICVTDGIVCLTEIYAVSW